jgi:hypothetical protein
MMSPAMINPMISIANSSVTRPERADPAQRRVLHTGS